MIQLRSILRKYRDILLYLVFGVLTTIVNYLVYFPCCAVGLPAAVSNAIAWVVSVLFAYSDQQTVCLWKCGLVLENRISGGMQVLQMPGWFRRSGNGYPVCDGGFAPLEQWALEDCHQHSCGGSQLHWQQAAGFSEKGMSQWLIWISRIRGLPVGSRGFWTVRTGIASDRGWPDGSRPGPDP